MIRSLWFVLSIGCGPKKGSGDHGQKRGIIGLSENNVPCLWGTECWKGCQTNQNDNDELFKFELKCNSREYCYNFRGFRQYMLKT